MKRWMLIPAVLVACLTAWAVTNQFTDDIILYEDETLANPTITLDASTGNITIDGSFSGSGFTSDVEDLSTSGAAGTAPLSDGASGLTMTDVLAETELDTESELEAQLTDTTDVFTNNDGALDDDDLTDNDLEELFDVDVSGRILGSILKWDTASETWIATGAGDTGVYVGDIDTEAEIEALVTDVTNFFTNNDGALDDDDVTDDDVEGMSTSGAAGTAPLSNGASGLSMTDVLVPTELDTEAELESALTDVTNVFTNVDGTPVWTTDIGSTVQAYDADLDDLADGTLTASKVQYGANFIDSAGTANQIWTSDGLNAGAWSSTASLSGLTLTGTLTASGQTLDFGTSGVIKGTSESTVIFSRPAAGNQSFSWKMNDSAAALQYYGGVYCVAVDTTAGSVDGKLSYFLTQNSSIQYNRWVLDNTGTTTQPGDATFQGGDLYAGVSGTTRGDLTAYHGSGGNTPGYLRLYADGGTPIYFWTTDAGVLRSHTAAPANDSDGSAVGSTAPTVMTLFPATGDGTATSSSVTTAAPSKMKCLSFDPSTEQYWTWQFEMPDSYSSGITCKMHWTNSSGSSSYRDVKWNAKAFCIADNGDVAGTYGTAQTVTDSTNGSSVTYLQTVSFGSAIVPGGTPAAGKLCVFNITRDATDVADDHPNAALLTSVELTFN